MTNSLRKNSVFREGEAPAEPELRKQLAFAAQRELRPPFEYELRMSNEVRMTKVQNPEQDGDVLLIPFGLRDSSFLRDWVLRHSSTDVTFNESLFSVGNGLCAIPRLRANAERQRRRSLQYDSPSRCIVESICKP